MTIGPEIHEASTAAETPWVDVVFRLQGLRIPLDHGYRLYAALSRILPAVHAHPAWGIHPIRGLRVGSDALDLTRDSRLRLRLPGADIGAVVALAGRRIEIDRAPLAIGTPEVHVLRPCSDMLARLVVIKGYFDEPDQFAEAIQRQLARNCGEAVAREVQVVIGRRRVLRVRRHTVIGFGVTLSGVPDVASLQLQTVGIGGKRLMGCGIFVPRGKRG